ncbi:hypothetical protein IMZ48_32260 [Candidatus Bathyarchaeota archaeon]|nr:hypothetical protein [Candidatus Bathyarchaeota archaeon]
MPGPPTVVGAAAPVAVPVCGKGAAEQGCTGRLCGAQAVEVRTARRKTTSVRLVRSQSQRSGGAVPEARSRAYQSRSSGSML